MSEINRILSRPDGIDKTVALVEWIQGLFPTEQVPVLVGGAVVEILTGGAYTTGDLDFVGSMTQAAAAALEKAGFERRGRHWVHPAARVFIEFPATSLGLGEDSISLEVTGRRLSVLAPEAVIADRLAAWQHWDSTTDAVNAFLVYRATRERLDRESLGWLVKERQVEEAWASLAALAARLGDANLSAAELERWAERKES